MKHSTRNIAVCFLLLFIVPILWQSIHQFHHAEELQYSEPSPVAGISTHEVHCAVCNYEFAKYDSQELPFCIPEAPCFSFFTFSHSSAVPERFCGFNHNLRAPPLFI